MRSFIDESAYNNIIPNLKFNLNYVNKSLHIQVFIHEYLRKIFQYSPFAPD